MIIGVDFDNTIANYDHLMHKLALEEDLIGKDTPSDKKKIRDGIRSLNDGEIKWQKLQAKTYGTFMAQAKLIDGVADFFAGCHKRGVSTFIVSHKTQFAAQDEDKVDLHSAALKWMEDKRLFQKVFFEPSRQKKIERIIQLGCTHFIDDLEEMFKEKTFPSYVEKILFTPQAPVTSAEGIKVFSNWKEIYEYFFNR